MKNLKLDNLSSRRFEENELSCIKGGHEGPCGCVAVCGCRYANSGGSITTDNANANGDVAGNRTHNAEHLLEEIRPYPTDMV